MSFNHIVDRIAVLSSAINEKASYASETASNYAEAMLSQPLAAYVREAEVVESRMFIVSQPAAGEISTAVDLKRKDAVSATPLKKAREAPLALLEPEEYIRSVLRLGEKYNVMPRAQSYARELLERTEELQKSIPQLERIYKERSSAISRSTPASAPPKKSRTLKEEERLTREAEARAATLREQRNILLKRLESTTKLGAGNTSLSDTSVFTSPSTMQYGASMPMMSLMDNSESSASAPAPVPKKRTTAQELQARRQARQAARRAERAQPPALPSDSKVTVEENAFWSGDGTPPSLNSFARALESQTDTTKESSAAQLDMDTDVDDQEPLATLEGAEAPVSEAEGDTGEEDGDGDVTVVLQPKEQAPSRRTFSLLRQSTTRTTLTPGRLSTKAMSVDVPPPVPPLLRAPTPVGGTIDTVELLSAESLPSKSDPEQTQEPVQPDQSVPSSASSLDATSSEVEIQMARVWRTIGEILIPDNSYSKNGATPGAEATLQILTAISDLPTKAQDPTGSAADATLSMLNTHRPLSTTTSVVPSAVQILTAAAILILLSYVVKNASSRSDDGYIWMPQNSLKAELKNNPWAVEGTENGGIDWVTKTMVKLVPTKMIVVDRKKGVVRFGRE